MNKDYKETKSNVFYTFLASVFGWKYEIESKKYRNEIQSYFEWKQWTRKEYITSIRTFKVRDKTIIEIETYGIGYLIGKSGQFIDGLRDHMFEELEEDIKIDLFECKMWENLY